MPYYYDVLNIKPDANNREITVAYRKLAGKYHPDKHVNDPNPINAVCFKAVDEAYNLLTDHEKRKTYDELNALIQPQVDNTINAAITALTPIILKEKTTLTPTEIASAKETLQQLAEYPNKLKSHILNLLALNATLDALYKRNPELSYDSYTDLFDWLYEQTGLVKPEKNTQPATENLKKDLPIFDIPDSLIKEPAKLTEKQPTISKEKIRVEPEKKEEIKTTPSSNLKESAQIANQQLRKKDLTNQQKANIFYEQRANREFISILKNSPTLKGYLRSLFEDPKSVEKLFFSRYTMMDRKFHNDYFSTEEIYAYIAKHPGIRQTLSKDYSEVYERVTKALLDPINDPNKTDTDKAAHFLKHQNNPTFLDAVKSDKNASKMLIELLKKNPAIAESFLSSRYFISDNKQHTGEEFFSYESQLKLFAANKNLASLFQKNQPALFNELIKNGALAVNKLLKSNMPSRQKVDLIMSLRQLGPLFEQFKDDVEFKKELVKLAKRNPEYAKEILSSRYAFVGSRFNQSFLTEKEFKEILSYHGAHAFSIVKELSIHNLAESFPETYQQTDLFNNDKITLSVKAELLRANKSEPLFVAHCCVTSWKVQCTPAHVLYENMMKSKDYAMEMILSPYIFSNKKFHEKMLPMHELVMIFLHHTRKDSNFYTSWATQNSANFLSLTERLTSDARSILQGMANNKQSVKQSDILYLKNISTLMKTIYPDAFEELSQDPKLKSLFIENSSPSGEKLFNYIDELKADDNAKLSKGSFFNKGVTEPGALAIVQKNNSPSV